MMKRIKPIYLVTLVLVIVAVFLVTQERKGTLKNKESEFAVDDTANITRIFFADKRNNVSELRKVSGGWQLNNKYTASTEAVNLMLKTLISIDVKAPVARSARNTVIRLMAAKSVKVEVYQKVYRINWFGKIRLFPHEKRTKTYFVGDHTMDNTGTYMLMDGSESPFVVFIPGLRGFVSTRYTAKELDWRDHSIFNLKLPDISQVNVSYAESPMMSFKITNRNNRNFILESLETNQPVTGYDTLKIIEYLGSFRKINFESIVNGFDKREYDSITTVPPTFVIGLQDKVGKQITLKAWKRKAAAGDVDLEGNPMDWDLNRMYASIEGTNELIVIQYFVFDRLLKPLDWFTDRTQPGSVSL